MKKTKIKRSVADRVRDQLAVGESKLISELRATLRVPRVEIEDCVNDAQDLDLIVGMRTHGGYGEYGKREWRIERYQ